VCNLVRTRRSTRSDSRATEVAIASRESEAAPREGRRPGILAVDLVFFEPFAWTARARGRPVASGSASRSAGVVEAHGGTISVSPNEARGVTFTVRLPRHFSPSP
jgi:hypothetical protein